MISLATWILWVEILAVAIWLGGVLTLFVAILPGEGGARVSAERRAQFLARWAPWPPCWGSVYRPFRPATLWQGGSAEPCRRLTFSWCV